MKLDIITCRTIGLVYLWQYLKNRKNASVICRVKSLGEESHEVIKRELRIYLGNYDFSYLPQFFGATAHLILI